MKIRKPWLTALLMGGIAISAAIGAWAADPVKPGDASAKTADAPAKAADTPAKGDDLKKIAESIDGYVFEFPCKDPMPEHPKPGTDGNSALVPPGADPKLTDNFKAEKTFGGVKGKHYLVTLRFRGVVEPMMYKNGKQDGDLFYIGGEPNNATYNIYKISVSSPESHYFLNRQDKVGHRIFTIDYTKTIAVDGQSTITFFGDGQNGRLITNFDKLVVPGVSPKIKQPYNGQFVQVDVVGVTEAK
ncbi:MAG TPA: hypothetical protein VFE47_12050 [Tepidisphaeraceae bacterium]|jgi:hypothetical protein|nr:hypothetical protein [Tepidisphaeraceae bacterium]